MLNDERGATWVAPIALSGRRSREGAFLLGASWPSLPGGTPIAKLSGPPRMKSPCQRLRLWNGIGASPPLNGHTKAAHLRRGCTTGVPGEILDRGPRLQTRFGRRACGVDHGTDLDQQMSARGERSAACGSNGSIVSVPRWAGHQGYARLMVADLEGNVAISPR